MRVKVVGIGARGAEATFSSLVSAVSGANLVVERRGRTNGREAEQSQKQLAAALLKKAKVKPCQTQD